MLNNSNQMFRYKRTTDFWVRPVHLHGYECVWVWIHLIPWSLLFRSIGLYKSMLICLSNKKCLLLHELPKIGLYQEFFRFYHQKCILYSCQLLKILMQNRALVNVFFIYIQSNLAIIKYYMYIIMTFLFVYTMIYIELN